MLKSIVFTTIFIIGYGGILFNEYLMKYVFFYNNKRAGHMTGPLLLYFA